MEVERYEEDPLAGEDDGCEESENKGEIERRRARALEAEIKSWETILKSEVERLEDQSENKGSTERRWARALEAEIKSWETNQRMDVERYEEDPLDGNDGCGESDSGSCSKCLRLSMFNKPFPDGILKLLEEKISFPNVSECRLESLRLSNTPDPFPLRAEHEIGVYLDKERPIYSESFSHIPNVEEGKELNVLDLLGDTLLSFNPNVPSFDPTKFRSYVGPRDLNLGFKPSKGGRNAQRIAYVESALNLKGKYVMIFCVFVPSIWDSDDGCLVIQTALASHELARRDDFVLVVVPMMRQGFAHSFVAYHHFLSGFSCLAVPFCDPLRREYICSALGFEGRIKAVILDPSQKVLFHGYPSVFQWVGGAEHECFPFTPEKKGFCLLRDCALQDLSLNELLGLGDADVLCNLSKVARITISELKHKLVGLYVCSGFHSLRKIHAVHEECKRQEYDLEIVVVCCPIGRGPPKLHEELMMDVLARLNLQDWWVFPFNNTVSHRLLRMCEVESGDEGFFIVDPIEKYVDPYGLPIIVEFGMDTYPFTRRSLVEKEFQRKMELRLSSLLLPWTHVCHKPASSSSIAQIPVAEALNNKTVLLYLYTEDQKVIAEKLVQFMFYEKTIRRKKSNVEVVAINIDGCAASDEYFMEKGWYWFVCPADPSKSAKLCDQYFHPRCHEGHEVLVAFGEDGKIQSVDASRFLDSRGPPFHGDLREEIGREFGSAGFGYMQNYDYTF